MTKHNDTLFIVQLIENRMLKDIRELPQVSDSSFFREVFCNLEAMGGTAHGKVSLQFTSLLAYFKLCTMNQKKTFPFHILTLTGFNAHVLVGLFEQMDSTRKTSVS